MSTSRSRNSLARFVNEKQLMLYYSIGKYISANSRKGFWGKGAIDVISERLQRELPGLRGFLLLGISVLLKQMATHDPLCHFCREVHFYPCQVVFM